MDTLTPQDPRDLRIAQLEAALAASQAEFAASQAALAIALERIAQLERRLGLDSTNSSKPPSSDSPKSRSQRRTRKSSGKAQGGQPGHDGAHRSLLDESKVDHFVEHLPSTCQHCGLELDETCLDGTPLREQTFELPALTPIITEHRLLVCRCKGCGKTTRAASPLAPGASHYGPNLLGLIGYLNVPMDATRRHTLAFLREYLALPASLGGIQTGLQVLGNALEPLGHQVRAECERATSVGCDETGWSHGGKRAWVWCVQSELAAFYSIEPKRDTAACKAVLGELGERVVVSDRYGAYNWIPQDQRQVCLAHLKRDFAPMAAEPGKLGELGTALEKLCGQICVRHSKMMAGEQTLGEYQDWVKSEARPAWQALIKQSEGWGARAPAVVHWCAQNEELVFRFGRGEHAIAPHNNASERAIRPSVIKRKISFGTQSEAGKKLLELSWTVSQTCKKVGLAVSSIYAQAIAAFQAGLPAPLLV